jgi:transposase
LVADRVRLVNQIRGLLGEQGIVVAMDIGNLRRALARIVGANDDRALNPLVRALMEELREELTELDVRIAGYDRKIRELYRHSEICQRLGKVEGIGPVTATALVAAVGDRSSFKNGRQFAAWLGLVPKQRSSGGRTWAGSRQAGSKKPVVRQNVAAATPQHCRCRARQQECTHRLELAHQRQRL